MKTLHAKCALLPGGWAADTEIAIDPGGAISRVRPGVACDPAAERVGLLLPGMPNLHSHAFQRALAGRTECAGSGPGSVADSFWTWRERMYGLANRITPDEQTVIATQLYVEMLQAGYTSVCEFHYLHQRPGGQRPHDAGIDPAADPATMSHALIAAASAAGIRLTLLPVLYLHGGFGARPPDGPQQRFTCTVDDYLALTAGLRRQHSSTLRTGVAFHSLRAVAPEAMAQVLASRADADPDGPVHIHVAEQLQEVRECETWLGRRPVEWLLDRGLVDQHWCLVHATHMTPAETRALADTGAVVGLCPTTEANLGDGLFPLAMFLGAGGRIGIGSDSHVSVSPVEELRWLEYGQRLLHGQRNVAASAKEPHTGARLYRAALTGGSQALGQPVGAIAAGRQADLLELDGGSPLLAGALAGGPAGGDEVLDRLVFAGNRTLVTNVMVAGRWVVRNGHHPLADSASAAFAEIMNRLCTAAGASDPVLCGSGFSRDQPVCVGAASAAIQRSIAAEAAPTSEAPPQDRQTP